MYLHVRLYTLKLVECILIAIYNLYMMPTSCILTGIPGETKSARTAAIVVTLLNRKTEQ